jgi:1A family penicillin-binding protein
MSKLTQISDKIRAQVSRIFKKLPRYAQALLTFAALTAALFLLFLYLFPISFLLNLDVVETSKIYDRNGVLLYETLHPEKGLTTELELSQISPFLIEATIAVEDERFYQHSGMDIQGLGRAVLQNLEAGQIVSGGSTITQQLVRNLIGTDKERTILQKSKEILLALRLEKVLSKDEILKLYLNTIYYGNLNYGVGAASYGYFGKDVSDLDLAESAFLAGLPQAPNRYDPFKENESAIERKNYVLELMIQNANLNPELAEEAQAQELHFQSSLTQVKAPHFVNFILEELEDRYGPTFVTDGLSVTTSLDHDLYEKVREISQENLDLLAGKNVTNAGVMVLDPESADILVMMGSVDYFNENIDGNVNMTTALRQPGSAMKPITYAEAFENGWHGATQLEDEAVRFFTADGNPYYPKNYDFEYHGTVTVRESLANSYNIPAILTIFEHGVENVLNLAREFGLTSLNLSADHYGLALTLGDGEVRLLDLTAVYMTFANGGLKKEPRSILEIKNQDGEIIMQAQDQMGTQIIEEDVAFMITDILSDTEARLPEFGDNNVLELDRPAAAKTGTTRNFRDNWTLGYTPNFIVGVWVGNNDNSQMREVSGIHGAGPIWHDVMQELHFQREIEQFQPPASVEQININGQLEWLSTRINYSEEALKVDTPDIEISSPFDQDTYQIQSSIPRESQNIQLWAEFSGSEESMKKMEEELEWWVGGELHEKGNGAYWNLEYGTHEIIAKSSELESLAISIHVE